MPKLSSRLDPGSATFAANAEGMAQRLAQVLTQVLAQVLALQAKAVSGGRQQKREV